MSNLSVYTRRDPHTSDSWSPFDSLVRTAFGPAGSTNGSSRRLDFTPAVETVRDGDDVVVRLELPGVDVSADVTVEVVANRLVVKGERRDERSEESSEQGSTRRISEIRYGSFERSFGLPGHVGADAVSASYDAGILSVRVAGVYAGTEPTRIDITQG
ncbi:heat-shock protein Hsp20 [Aeromicrobium sp. Root495]|uniref:Hsp20/alpha crystallin family protein n=1 Tax=Aeromicrobium sp. Root495 TaxID=1736550 RepID=UPI0006FB0FE0|nr:Hsp20/alpha crystallin family protein [Aeromicrobium sp. Root495]KQY60170.1 heat-shock protein Hsp20 [Aeromicrobium sp. Root495]